MIELRSDTFTSPSPGMRAAMAEAPVGDDVFGEDPTVNALQASCAELLGKQAGLFTPSGTMGNQIAMHTATRPGDEALLEASSHIFLYEGGAPAMLSGVQARPVQAPGGLLSPELLRPAVRPRNDHFPRTSFLALENTHNSAGGTVYSLEELDALCVFASENNLFMHLDGARLFNAVMAMVAAAPGDWRVTVREIAARFDSVTFCFSKGLGAPVGSMLCGDSAFIEEARRARKKLGGGMRQAGILAAAGAFALRNNVERLVQDHENARLIAAALTESPRFEIEVVPTNIIRFRDSRGRAGDVQARLLELGVKLLALDEYNLRAVTHLDVSREEAQRAGEIILTEFG